MRASTLRIWYAVHRWTSLICTLMVSGLILYAPFTRKLAFGLLRFGKSTRVINADFHNLFGAAVTGFVVWLKRHRRGATASATTTAPASFALSGEKT